MKVIVFNSEDVEETIAHFIAYGYTDFIVYSRVNKDYYEMNEISVTQINGFDVEGNGGKLSKIKGSLTELFFVVYSSQIVDFEVDNIEIYHRQKQGIATLIEEDRKLIGALLEPEIFDYVEDTCSFEKEALLRVGQDGELAIYN